MIELNLKFTKEQDDRFKKLAEAYSFSGFSPNADNSNSTVVFAALTAGLVALNKRDGNRVTNEELIIEIIEEGLTYLEKEYA